MTGRWRTAENREFLGWETSPNGAPGVGTAPAHPGRHNEQGASRITDAFHQRGAKMCASCQPLQGRREANTITLKLVKARQDLLRPLVKSHFSRRKAPGNPGRLAVHLPTHTRSGGRIIHTSTAGHFVDKGVDNFYESFGLLTMDRMPASREALEACIRE